MRPWLFAAIIAFGTVSQPAFACRSPAKIVLDDVRYAEVVLVGRISDYRLVRNEAFRRERLNNPRLSPEARRWFEGPEWLLPDYARFNIEVDEVLVGSAPQAISVTWDNSTFGEPETMDAGPFLIALRLPASPSPPLRGPSATFSAAAEPSLPTLLQAPCSTPFLFPNTSEEASAIRQILSTRSP